MSSKILEHIITSNLAKYLENQKKLTSGQHGFQSCRSCESQLIDLTSHKVEVDACFLDFSKLFDKVDHSKLVKKLIQITVNSQVTNWTRNFLAQHTQIVVEDGYRSTAKPVTLGVSQESVVGSALFLVYINDMLTDINSEVGLFADDTVIYNLAENNTELQDDLRKLEIWETA